MLRSFVPHTQAGILSYTLLFCSESQGPELLLVRLADEAFVDLPSALARQALPQLHRPILRTTLDCHA